jgi:hypothetical protein
MITITRKGKLITATLTEDGNTESTFTCDRRTINQAIALTNTLRCMNEVEGKDFVAIRNMMQYDKI